MFTPHSVYTHNRMLDLCIYVIRRSNPSLLGDARYRLLVAWYYRTGESLGITEEISIKPKDVKDWYQCA